MSNLILKPNREKSLLRRHPWIFSGAIQKVNGKPTPGETVNLLSSKGDFLAQAAYSPTSQIRARVWTFDPDELLDSNFFLKRIRKSLASRQTLHVAQHTNAYRLIHAESDGLPGLIVDRYADVLVLQSLTAGSEYWKDTITDILIEETGLTTIYERSDADVRQLEGLEPKVGLLHGELSFYSIPVVENNLKFTINLNSGHKTGYYLDQRENRLRVRELSKGRDVLDCFCYTGGFTVYALEGGAKNVVAVDASEDALILGRENVKVNGHQADAVEWREGDVFQVLRKFRDEGRSFDLIILDPPKFAPTASQAGKAARGYKDINLLGFKLLRPGGFLVTFSCSGGVDASLFQKIIASAAIDAGVDAQIVDVLTQGTDHPVALNFPEGAYLKGLVCLKS